MHAIGVGGLLGLMLIVLNINTSSSITLPMSLALLIAGIVCTSRMIVSNHTQKDIYIGLIIGIICQFISAALIL
jgi:membrane-associated phospholipid phosphatase